MYTKDGMNMYVGIYRVVCEFCQQTLKPCKEDNYIYCKNKGQIYRYNDETLVYYRKGKNKANTTVNTFKAQGIQVINNLSTDEDLEIKFYEKDISKVVQLVGARTLGSDIKSTSKRNLKLFKWFNDNKQFYINNRLYEEPRELTEEEKEVYRQRLLKTKERMRE